MAGIISSHELWPVLREMFDVPEHCTEFRLIVRFDRPAVVQATYFAPDGKFHKDGTPVMYTKRYNLIDIESLAEDAER